MSETTPRIGQVRHFVKIETDGDGIQHLTDRTSEAWTGTEWADVRELVGVVRAADALLTMWGMEPGEEKLVAIQAGFATLAAALTAREEAGR